MAIEKRSCYLYVDEDEIGDLLTSGIVCEAVEEVFCPAWLMSVNERE